MAECAEPKAITVIRAGCLQPVQAEDAEPERGPTRDDSRRAGALKNTQAVFPHAWSGLAHIVSVAANVRERFVDELKPPALSREPEPIIAILGTPQGGVELAAFCERGTAQHNR